MGKLKDLSQFMSDGHDLPINGKTYHVPLVDAETGLAFTRFISVAMKAKNAQENNEDYTPDDEDIQILSDQQERDIYKEVLRDGVWEEMVEDGLAFAHMRMAALYALYHATQGEEVANRFWESGGKAPAPNRAARRTATRTRTGGANTTQKQASPKGTNTRTANRRTRG